MLLNRMRWHNAFQQDPHREARLLAFAKDKSILWPADNDNNEERDPDAEIDSMTPEQVQKEHLKELRRERRERIRDTMEQKEPRTPEENKEAQKEGDEIPPAIDPETKRDAIEEAYADTDTAEDSFSDAEAAEKPLNAAELLNKAEELQKKIGSTQQSIAIVLDRAKNVMPGDFRAQMEKDEAFLSYQYAEIEKRLEVLTMLRDWDNGNALPSELHKQVKDKWKEEDKAKALNALFTNTNTTDDKWGTINYSDKITVIRDSNAILETGTLFSAYDADFNNLGSLLEEAPIMQKIALIQKELEKMPPEGEEIDEQNILTTLVNSFEYTSLLNMWNAAKQWYESWEEEWKANNRVRESRLARKFGQALQWLPYGEESLETLEQNVDKHDNEEKEKFIKYLEGWSYNYDQLFRDNGVFARNYHNPNRARAILEYAAEKGFIYQIDEKWLGGVDPEKREFFGHTMEELFSSIWDGPKGKERMNQYFKKLLSKQRGGEKKQIESGKDQVDAKAEAATIIQQLDAELRSGNLFKAIGMAEVAMSKGKEGEISAWLTTTILRAFRKNDKVNLNNIVVVEFFEKLGNMGLGHPGHTLFQVKAAKNELVQSAGTNFAQAGMIGEIITEIEKDIQAKSTKSFKSPDSKVQKKLDKELDHLVAKVLAAQTLKLEKGNVSIFDNNRVYQNYRRKMMDSEYVQDLIMTADDDFYGGADSEILLIAPSQVAAALAYTEGGASLKFEAKAKNFLKLIINRNDELKKTDPVAYRIYQREMGEKLEEHMNKLLRTPATFSIAGTSAITERSKDASKGQPRKQEEYLFGALFERGILDRSLLEPYIGKGKENTLGYVINQQITKGTMKAPKTSEPVQKNRIPQENHPAEPSQNISI
jgi:hypothetical protein